MVEDKPKEEPQPDTESDETKEEAPSSSPVLKKGRTLVFSVVALLFFTLVALFILLGSDKAEAPNMEANSPVKAVITTYQECIDAGYLALETFPETCTDDSGETFTRALSSDEIYDYIQDLPNAKSVFETPVVPGTTGDQADDMVIWEHPTDPEKSVIIADDKSSNGGLIVYDLEGKQLQYLGLEAVGNVDLKHSFTLNNGTATVIAAAGRTSQSLLLLQIDHETRKISDASARFISLGFEPYGLCMYNSKESDKTYAFITARESGRLDQYELIIKDDKVDATRIDRQFGISSLSEGCVADDELGHLYVAEEDAGLWKYSAEPDGGEERTQVDTEENGGNTGFDLEGISLVYGQNGDGYLIVSRQGDSNFALYDRRDDNAFIKTFRVERNGDIDEVTETDGLDVRATNLGKKFPYGLLVVHDNNNSGGKTSNLKFVPLEDVIGTLHLNPEM